MKTAVISEIYASVQGEGPFTGERQIFVRLAGCPLRCAYCDTPGSLVARGHPTMTVAEALKGVRAARGRKKISTVSVTGGEPLAQVGFLEEFLPAVQRAGFRTYLETAGIHPDGVKRVAAMCDVISMDIKLPSATGRAYWEEHRRFLEAGGKRLFVKIVIERRSRRDEIERAVLLAADATAKPTVILQPATSIPGTTEEPTAEQLADAFAFAQSRVARVLVMPQQHKFWSVR